MSDEEVPDRMATAAAYDENRRTQPAVPKDDATMAARRLAAMKALQEESDKDTGSSPAPKTAPAAAAQPAAAAPAASPAAAAAPAAKSAPAAKPAASSGTDGEGGGNQQMMMIVAGVVVVVLILLLLLL